MRKKSDSIVRSLRFPVLVVAAAALVACGRSHNQTGGASRAANEAFAIDTVTAVDKVKSIDYATRMVTLESPNGTTERYHVGPEMKNFNQVHVGDQVQATVAESLVVGVRKAGTAPNMGETVTVALAPKGAKPGMFVTKTTEATAKIVGIDPASRTITLAEPAGKPKIVKLAPAVDVSNLKRGDDVVVRYTDAVALAVEKP
jgi:Cu/Ag efflux protein CusF